MSKASRKIVSLVLLLPLLLLNVSLAKEAKCASGGNGAPMPCCSTQTPVHKAVGANFSTAPCGCNMAPAQTVPSPANATLVETSTSGKNIDCPTILSPQYQSDLETVRPPVAVSGRLPLLKSITTQKIFTLISSFLI